MLARTISADFPGTLFLATVMAGRRDSIAAEAAEETEWRSSLCRPVAGDAAADDVAPVPPRPAPPGDPDDPFSIRKRTCQCLNLAGQKSCGSKRTAVVSPINHWQRRPTL
jgi:hypothetical protein